MKELCSGGVIYLTEGKKKLFLLIKSSSTGWVFPKGHVEEGEDLKSAALREIKEETGLDNLEINDNYYEKISFITIKGNEKEVHYFLFRSTKKEIVLSDEHLEYKWLKYTEAYQLVDHENQKRLLNRANEVLK